jgi:hypothetical protein
MELASRKTRSVFDRYNPMKMEAPSGFEPEMEVLQTSRDHNGNSLQTTASLRQSVTYGDSVSPQQTAEDRTKPRPMGPRTGPAPNGFTRGVGGVLSLESAEP